MPRYTTKPPLIPYAIPMGKSHAAIVSAAVEIKVFPGVYCLVHDDEVVYVGASKDVLRRVFEHRHKAARESDGKRKVFNRVAYFPCYTLSDALQLEARLIAELTPKYNRRGATVAGMKFKPWLHRQDANVKPSPSELVRAAIELAKLRSGESSLRTGNLAA